MTALKTLARFFRVLWAGIDSVRKVLHLILLLFVFALIGGILSPPPATLPASAALVLAPAGALVEELEGGSKNVLINLQDAKTIDSSGLGELIRCKVTATSHEAEVKLLNVNLKARKLLTMAQLVGVFEMFDDEELAVASFSE